jgi:hypothetical protein
MKLILGIVAALILFAGLSQAIGSQEEPIVWKPLIGAKLSGATIFYDEKIEVSETDNKKLVFAQILFSFNSAQETKTVSNKTVQYRGLVKQIAVACDSAIMVSVRDFYFINPMPNKADEPVSGFEYTEDLEKTARNIPKESPVYKTLCPQYI